MKHHKQECKIHVKCFFSKLTNSFKMDSIVWNNSKHRNISFQMKFKLFMEFSFQTKYNKILTSIYSPIIAQQTLQDKLQLHKWYSRPLFQNLLHNLNTYHFKIFEKVLIISDCELPPPGSESTNLLMDHGYLAHSQ